MIELSITILELDRIAAAIERLALIQSAARFTFKLKFGAQLMRTYKSDHPDFDFRITITATDSEGNVIADAPIPASHTLTVGSDNEAAFTVIQDAGDPRIVHAHVGGPNPDSTPATAIVTATLLDSAGNLVASGADQVIVTVGDPAAISAISFNLPE